VLTRAIVANEKAVLHCNGTLLALYFAEQKVLIWQA
jgi:hypothetical protein